MRPASLLSVAVASALALGATAAVAQLPSLDEYRVRSFGPDDGLPLTEVWDVARDADGRLIASTAGGLFQYTGYRFVALDVGDLPGAIFRDLEPSAEGEVWFATAEGVVGYVRDGRAHPVASVPNEPWRLQRGPEGRIWALGLQGLVWIDAAAPGGFRSVPELEGVAAAGVFGVGGESIALSERGGYRLVAPPGSGTFLASDTDGAPRPVRAEPVPGIPAPGSLTVRWQDEWGLWIPLLPGEDALVLVDPEGVSRFGPGDAPYDRGFADGRRVVRTATGAAGERWWFSVDGEGRPELVRERNGVRIDVGAREGADLGFIRNLVLDDEGIVWATTTQGLVQFAPRSIQTLSAGPVDGAFTAPILQDSRGRVWIGTWGRGLVRYDTGRSERIFMPGDGLPSDRVRALREDRRGGMWVGTMNGLARIVGDGVVDGWSGTEVRTIAEGPDGAIWVGDLEGLGRIAGARLVREHVDILEGRPVHDLHFARDGALWIATDHGLYRRTSEGTLIRFGADDGLRDDWIDSIHEEDDGTLWIGTYGAGIHRYRGDRFVPVTTVEGLHDDGVWRMLPDDHGGVWMSSDVGLARVDRARLHRVADAVEEGRAPEEPLQPLLFTEASGMPSRESNRASPGGWRLDDGRLLFNNMRGVVVVDPERALAGTDPPNADVTTFSVDGREAPARSGPLVVPAGTRHLGIEFAAHALAVPERNRYRVRLEGFDPGWVEVGTRHRVEYTALAPGRYTFHVQAARPLGGWGEATVLPIRIEPLLWQAKWFRLLLATAVAGALLAIHRLRVRRAVETERMRLRIAADLHDDVGANLISIALLSDLLERSLESTSPEEQHRRLRRIRGAAQSTVDSLRDIIWLVDPQNDRLGDLIERMHDLASGLVPAHRLTLRASNHAPERAVGMERARNTLLVFKEALQNAVKHGNVDSLSVTIESLDDRVRFRISDRGPGFDPDATTPGYGLANMRRRASEAGAALTVASGNGDGTVVTFEMPLP